MKKLALLLNLIFSLLIVSCGDNSEFRIAGTIEGLGTQNLWLYYYAGDAVRTQNTILLDGKFSVVGYAEEPTIVEIYSTNKVLLGRILVENGQTVDCIIDNANRYNVAYDGNEVSAQWAEFLKENASVLSSKDNDASNKLIEEYIMSHRDNMLSTLLLLTEYHAIDNELMADSLLQMINPEVRQRSLVGGFEAMLEKINSEQARSQVKTINLFSAGDSIYAFSPDSSSYSVLIFSDVNEAMRDSVVEMMRRWNKDIKDKELNVIDVAFAPDTAAWKKAIKDDDATWKQCWALGGVEAKGIDRLAIPRAPYFVIADSAGIQLFRGSSMAHATEIIDSLKVKK